MIRRGLSAAGVAVVCGALVAAPSSAEPPRVWGTCSAVVSQNPRYQNQWEYTMDVGWDATGWEPERLEQVGLVLDLASCPCIGDSTYFAFPYTNGTGTGKDGRITHYYYLGYSLTGEASRFAADGPAIVFEYADTSSELNVQGSARFVFVSTARPGEHRARLDGVGIAVGPHQALGEIVGVFPTCECWAAPAQPATTWGVMKAMFR